METYFFPINAALNISTTGYLEFKKADGVYITDLGRTRKVYSKKPQVLTKFDGLATVSKLIDMKAIRRTIARPDNEEVKYLVLNVSPDQHVTLSLD